MHQGQRLTAGWHLRSVVVVGMRFGVEAAWRIALLSRPMYLAERAFRPGSEGLASQLRNLIAE